MEAEYSVRWEQIKEMRIPKSTPGYLVILAGETNGKRSRFLCCSNGPKNLHALVAYYSQAQERGLADANASLLYHYLFEPTNASVEWFAREFPQVQHQLISWVDLNQPELVCALFTRPILLPSNSVLLL